MELDLPNVEVETRKLFLFPPVIGDFLLCPRRRGEGRETIIFSLLAKRGGRSRVVSFRAGCMDRRKAEIAGLSSSHIYPQPLNLSSPPFFLFLRGKEESVCVGG